MIAGGAVTVVAVSWTGTVGLTLTYRTADGQVGERLLFRDDEPNLHIAEEGRPWAFDGDAEDFKLASEAKRISLAHLFDPYVAVSTSLVEPLPHQITAVYEHLIPRQPLAFLLADDPGAGKTIMTGLFIRELIIRGDLRRCLIVAPGSLVEQWQQELAEKFQLHFAILTRDRIEAAQSNPFGETDLLIARLDKLSRDEELQARLTAAPEWDLIVFDEAHKLAASLAGDEVSETKRRRMARTVAIPHARNVLLLTATPHNGKEEDFELFMALLDPDRYAGHRRSAAETLPPAPDANDLMRRLVKESLVKFDGRPLFPPRFAYVVRYELSDPEAALYEQVTTYVREEMARAEQLKDSGEKRRGLIVGFALTVLQRRLASSPAAIHSSLRRRRERLERTLADLETQVRGRQVRETSPDLNALDALAFDLPDDDLDEDDIPADETEEVEEAAVDLATAARTADELRREIATLRRLEAVAADVRARGTDTKWTELSSLLQDHPEMRDAGGGWRKLVVFTEHRDTLDYLVERIGRFLGRPEAVVAIHGGLPREQRRAAEARFKTDPDAIVLVATDAAGEGINLQRAHLMVNYDLPWNPNRLEQRFGRIHRIGQEDACHVWNLVAHRTREGDVYARLLEKLDAESKALGGAVFDVLGRLTFEGRPLRELLIEAIRTGDSPEVRAQLDQIVDDAVDIEHLRSLLDERAIGADVMDLTVVSEIREQMERANAARLQPHYIRAFFLDAFRRLGGSVVPREQDRFEVTRVPARVRDRAREAGLRPGVQPRYERITFDKDLIAQRGRPLAELVCPGHPLLDATIDVVLGDHRDLLRRGTLLLDPTDPGDELRVLVYLEHSIVDGRSGVGGQPLVVSRRLEFVDLTADGVTGAGAAPYLDHLAVGAEDARLVEPVIESADWLSGTIVDTRASAYAIEHLTRAHLAEVRERTLSRVEKTRAQVVARLRYEITYWDGRAAMLAEQEAAGKKTRLPADVARRRAEELAQRLDTRLRELDQEAKVDALPPVVVGGAIIVPQGLLDRLTGTADSSEPDLHARETARVERLAMDAVMAAERSVGREPRDVGALKLGYDVESQSKDGRLRFIEVKGRADGATTVTVTKNEIMKSFAVPDSWFLAIVPVDGDNAQPPTTYLRRPFKLRPEEAATSVNYAIGTLMEQGEHVEVAA